MFSWICPQCGHDVPPSKTDCPYCEERAKEAAAAAAAAPPIPVPPPYPYAAEAQPGPWQQPPQQAPPPQWQAPPPPPQYQAPPQQYAPQPPPYGYPYAQQPPPAWQPQPARAATPLWLMVIGFAVVFLVIGGGIYYAIQHFGASTTAEKAGLENPTDASKQKVSNPLQKYVEVVGLRLMEESKKPVARFVLVNHSTTGIEDLKANVTLWASTSRSEEDSIGSFSFSIGSIGPDESKELTEPLKTKLKMYELPDWQNATAEIQITSPAP